MTYRISLKKHFDITYAYLFCLVYSRDQVLKYGVLILDYTLLVAELLGF